MNKIYYAKNILPLGYREETDKELRARIQISKNAPIISRALIPLKEGEKVILKTHINELEMSEVHKHIRQDKLRWKRAS